MNGIRTIGSDGPAAFPRARRETIRGITRPVRGAIKQFAHTTLFSSFVDLLDRVSRPRSEAFAVLNYHRVAEPEHRPDLYPGLISATPGEFEAQIGFLASNYPLIGLPDLLAARRDGRPLPDGAVAVTFDDAYGDFSTAWEILRAHGVPVTMFVPTDYPARPESAFWWDRVFDALASSSSPGLETPAGALPCSDHGARMRSFRRVRELVHRLPHDRAMEVVDDIVRRAAPTPKPPSVLGWKELRSLRSEGVTMAPHTRSHPLLDTVSQERAHAEIAGSLRDLTQQGVQPESVLAYPDGAFTERVVRAARAAGIEIALSTQRGLNTVDGLDWMRLRRINVGRNTSPSLLRLQMINNVDGPAHELPALEPELTKQGAV